MKNSNNNPTQDMKIDAYQDKDPVALISIDQIKALVIEIQWMLLEKMMNPLR